MIGDPMKDLECLRWPTKEIQGAITQQRNKITLILGWGSRPKWWVGRYFAQGEVLLILWHNGWEMFQSFRNCNGSLVMADPYHHAWEYHLRFPGWLYFWVVMDTSEKQCLVVQVLVISVDPMLGILHLPLDNTVQIYHQHRDEGDGTEQLVHMDVKIHVQPVAQPQDFWVFRQPFVSKSCVWIHPNSQQVCYAQARRLGKWQGSWCPLHWDPLGRDLLHCLTSPKSAIEMNRLQWRPTEIHTS